tara:strand:+ start:185 stop:1129 length:945 start_codon:yes stop_codon:yes gene_type:complete
MYDTYIDQWKKQGFTIIKNVVDSELVNKCENFLNKKYNSESNCCKDFGSLNGELEFPSGEIIDQISINENIIKIVKKMLNTDNITLIQSDAWSKYGEINVKKNSNKDQRMHMDYGNNTFLHPSSWEDPEVVSIIIYFSDTKITGGGTSVVPKQGKNDILYQPPYINMPGQNNYPFINNKQLSEKYFYKYHPEIYNFRKKLYDREIITSPNVGDILFYRLDTWHRGTPVNNGCIRNVMNLAWKKSECTWINNWNRGWTKKMYYGNIEKLFVDMTPIQRATLGIPLPGDGYWNIHKLQLLKKRYPNLNTTPYISKL